MDNESQKNPNLESHSITNFSYSQETISESLLKSVDDGSHHEVIILAPFLILLTGAILQSTKSIPLPYTMQLLIIGTVLGLLLHSDEWSGTLRQSLNYLANMDPHLMLHIFLPPLIFVSVKAFNKCG